MTARIKLRVVKRRGGWWIAGLPVEPADDPDRAECGPYRTRAEADSDRRGLERFYAREAKGRLWMTSESKRAG